MTSDPTASVPDGVRVDVPVVLRHARVVFNLDHAPPRDDTVAGIVQLQRVLAHVAEHGDDGRLAAVFHGAAAHLTLSDAAYDRSRGTTGGNPQRAALEALARGGVSIEVCANTMRAHGWTNADLLPEVRVTTAAVLRLVELHGEGFAEIHP